MQVTDYSKPLPPSTNPRLSSLPKTFPNGIMIDSRFPINEATLLQPGIRLLGGIHLGRLLRREIDGLLFVAVTGTHSKASIRSMRDQACTFMLLDHARPLVDPWRLGEGRAVKPMATKRGRGAQVGDLGMLLVEFFTQALAWLGLGLGMKDSAMMGGVG